MTDVLVRFRGDPSEALQASREVDDALDGIQQQATQAAQAVPKIIPSNLNEGTSMMDTYKDSMNGALGAMGALGVSTGKFGNVLRLLHSVLTAATSAKVTAAGASEAYTGAVGRATLTTTAFSGAVSDGTATQEGYKTALRGTAKAFDEIMTESVSFEKHLQQLQQRLRFQGKSTAEIDVITKAYTLSCKNLTFTQRSAWIQIYETTLAQQKGKLSLDAHTASMLAADAAVKKCTVSTKGLTAATAALNAALTSTTLIVAALVVGVAAAMWHWNRYKKVVEEAAEAEKKARETGAQAFEDYRDSQRAFINEVESMAVEWRELTLSEEEALTKNLQLEHRNRTAAVKQEMADALYHYKTAAYARGATAKETAAEELAIRKKYAQMQLAVDELYAEKAQHFYKQRQQQILEIEQGLYEQIQTWGMDEVDLMARKLRALGAEEDKIRSITDTYREFLDITKEQKEEEEERLDIQQRMQMIGLTQMYRRIQEASATPPRTIDKDTKIQERQLDEQMKQTELLREMERRLPSVGVLN